jgi:hypothetical protein
MAHMAVVFAELERDFIRSARVRPWLYGKTRESSSRKPRSARC